MKNTTAPGLVSIPALFVSLEGGIVRMPSLPVDVIPLSGIAMSVLFFLAISRYGKRAGSEDMGHVYSV